MDGRNDDETLYEWIEQIADKLMELPNVVESFQGLEPATIDVQQVRHYLADLAEKLDLIEDVAEANPDRVHPDTVRQTKQLLNGLPDIVESLEGTYLTRSRLRTFHQRLVEIMDNLVAIAYQAQAYPDRIRELKRALEDHLMVHEDEMMP